MASNATSSAGRPGLAKQKSKSNSSKSNFSSISTTTNHNDNNDDPEVYDEELEAEAFKNLAMKVFDVFDGDKDGFLNQRELGMALRKLDKNVSEADITSVLNQVPHASFGASGKISTEHFGRIIEFISHKGQRATAEISEAAVEEALSAFDIAHSGTINIEFLLSVLEQTNGPDKLSPQESTELLQLVEGDPAAVPMSELLNIFFPVTDAELQEVEERKRNKKKQKATKYIFKEIYDTEKNYVQSLDYCVHAFMRPMLEYIRNFPRKQGGDAVGSTRGPGSSSGNSASASNGPGGPSPSSGSDTSQRPIITEADVKVNSRSPIQTCIAWSLFGALLSCADSTLLVWLFLCAQSLFSNWESLLQVNRELLRQMESLGPLNVWSWSKGLIPILLDFIPKLKVRQQQGAKCCVSIMTKTE